MKKKLNFRFHDPNPAGVAAEYILKELVAANLPKAERAIREAKMRENVLKNKKNRSVFQSGSICLPFYSHTPFVYCSSTISLMPARSMIMP